MPTFALMMVTLILVLHEGRCVEVFVYQKNGVPNAEDAGLLHLAKQNLSVEPQPAVEPGWEGVPYIRSLTLCYRAYIFYFRIKACPVSYAVSSKYINEIYSDMSPFQTGFALFASFFSASMTLEQDIWYHICLWFDYASGIRRIYVQGEAMVEEQFESFRPLYLNGTLVLGQEQDDRPGGGFDWYQSMSGKITQVNLWSRPLKPEEIHDIAHCSSDLQGDIVSWNEAPWSITPNVSKEELALESFCQPTEEPFFLTFPEPRTIDASRYLCTTFGTAPALPADERQNQRLKTTAGQFAESCSARGALWLGIQDIDAEGEWSTFPENPGEQGKSWSYLPFGNQQPDGGRIENCAIIELLRGGWSDWACSSSNLFCAACMSKKPVIFTLRGLCETDKFQYQFSLVGYVNNKPLWRGLHNYQIEYHDQKWILEDLYTSTKLATKDAPEPTNYPMGVGLWNILVNKTVCAASAGDLHTFSLTSCDHVSEYTCNDGSCISSDRRCNLRNDCSDGSDEDGCENVVLSPGYRPNLPPPPTNHTRQSAPIGLAVIMDRFSKIDTLNMEVTLDFSVVLSWTEPRSNYLNLKSPPKINVVQVREGKPVWRPSMNFPSGNDILRVRLETFTIIRKGSPIPDDLSRPLQDQVFRGEDATFNLMWKISMPFSCNMQLLYYPFDVQVCQIPVVMSSASVEYLHFSNLVVGYLGERLLTEVEVGELSITSRMNTTQSTADVRVVLKRRYAFHLTSTYLPTVLLIIVGYGTLYIRLAMFQVRSIMSLTTLLVLTSLYTQTAASLPKTSYLKAIDVWLLYCITILVVIIIAHIFTDYMEGVQTHVKKVSPIGSGRIMDTSVQSWFENRPIAKLTIAGMRILVPLSFLIFNIAYWSFIRGAI